MKPSAALPVLKSAPTTDELLTELRAVVGARRHDPGVTVRQYARAAGINDQMARSLLEQKVVEGRVLKGVSYLPRTDGRCANQVVYRPVP
jgi:hypothetical protein